MNNFAILKTIRLDSSDILEKEWNHQLTQCGNFSFKERNYVDYDFFTPYFKKQIDNISEVVGPYKNLVLQVHDKSLYDNKWYLNVIHKDAERKTCITIPVKINKFEPINFYDIINNDTRGANPNQKPSQRVIYSTEHPNLVNVNHFHNVRVIEDDSPRVLLQLSYDLEFEEIVSSNRECWEIL